MLISRQAVNEYLERRFDDFTWMKRLDRETLLQEINQFRVRPEFKTPSWLHQLVCFYIGMCHPQFLFLLDMGLGKSKILMDLITQRQRQKQLDHALIAVPRLINVDGWAIDMTEHSNLEPWTIAGSDIEEKRERLLNPKGDVTLIDYPGLHLALSKKEKIKGKGKNRLIKDDKLIKRARSLYNFIGLDEIHKLANTESLWFSIINQLTKDVDYCYGTTGTLFGRDVQAIWPQFYLVDRGETFGENLGIFRKSLFDVKMSPWKGQEFTFNKSMDKQLHRMLQHRSIRYDEDEVPELEVPKRQIIPRYCTMGEEQREHYLRALEGLINAGGQVSELEASWIRMRQIISGYLVWDDANGHHVMPFKQNPKLDLMESVIDEMTDSKVVITYDYTETGKIISERLQKLNINFEWFYGGTKDKPASKARFMNDPRCRVFLMNYEAGGTGTDGLQKVARYMVDYEVPKDPTTRTQTIKRIHRPGQTKRSLIYDLIMQRSMDKGMLEALNEGIDLYDRVVNHRNRAALRSILLGG